MSDQVTKTPELDEMHRLALTLLAIVQARLGPRSSAILMIGTLIDDTSHDRFTVDSFGPCLMARGLLHWGVPAITKHFDDEVKRFGQTFTPATTIPVGTRMPTPEGIFVCTGGSGSAK